MNSKERIAVLIGACLAGFFVVVGYLVGRWVPWLKAGASTATVASASPGASPSSSPSASASPTSSPSPSPSGASWFSPPTPPPSPSPTRPKRKYRGTNPKLAPLIRFNSAVTRTETTLWVENLTGAPVTVQCSLQRNVNTRGVPPLPRTVTLSGRQKLAISKLMGVNRYRGWSCDPYYHWVYGNMEASHERDYAYGLPYAADTSHRLIGTGSAKEPLYSFAMPEDTEVCCARDGKVVATEERYDRSSRSLWTMNYVMVLHDDGTLGYYGGLRAQGAAVAAGQQVNAGDVLGYSGDTSGFAFEPSLCLVVFKASNAKGIRTFPMQFVVDDSQQAVPVKGGQVYTSVEM